MFQSTIRSSASQNGKRHTARSTTNPVFMHASDTNLFVGDIVSLKIFGRRLYVLNSRAAAVELFEKRSAIYSERPKRNMANLWVGSLTHRHWELLLTIFVSWRCGFGRALLLQSYGDVARKTRKIMHAEISQHSGNKHVHIQEREVHSFVQRICLAPENLCADSRRSTGFVLAQHMSYWYPSLQAGSVHHSDNIVWVSSNTAPGSASDIGWGGYDISWEGYHPEQLSSWFTAHLCVIPQNHWVNLIKLIGVYDSAVLAQLVSGRGIPDRGPKMSCADR